MWRATIKKKVFYLFSLIILVLGCWLTAVFYFGPMWLGAITGLAPVWLIVFALLSWVFASGLAAGAKRMNTKVWVYAGLLILVLWFLPASQFVKLFPVQDGDPLGIPLAFTLLLIISLALIVLALLLNSGLRLYKTWQNADPAAGSVEIDDPEVQRKYTGRTAVTVLIMVVLLLGGALYNFYWFMVWDSTGDGLGYLWLPVPILAILSSAVMLSRVLPERTKLAVLLFLLLIPAMIAITVGAQGVDSHRLTKARAVYVNQAIQNYYARNERYPDSLRALIPRYLLSIPEPVIIYGQDWCYDSGEDYYRFGYIDREHWSAPHFIGRIYQTKGEAPYLNGVCEQEAVTLQKRHPDFPYEYWVEGN